MTTYKDFCKELQTIRDSEIERYYDVIKPASDKLANNIFDELINSLKFSSKNYAFPEAEVTITIGLKEVKNIVKIDYKSKSIDCFVRESIIMFALKKIKAKLVDMCWPNDCFSIDEICKKITLKCVVESTLY